MNDDTLDYRWFCRFSDCGYFPDYTIEIEFDDDEFPGWASIPFTPHPLGFDEERLIPEK